MVTVGYGDITPQNPLEVSISIITIMLSCGVYAYTLNAIGTIFLEHNRSEKEIQINLSIINDYMISKNISNRLRI